MKQRKQRMSVILALVMICSLLVGGWPGTISETNAADSIKMLRLYNPNSGEHFYTASTSEKDNLVAVGWKYEGEAWDAPATSGTPVYRLYNPNNGDHHYTTSVGEKDSLVNGGWKYENIGWYSDDTNAVPMYRLYNPNCRGAGSHHYTTNVAERNNLISAGWKYENVAWYGSGTKVEEDTNIPKPTEPKVNATYISNRSIQYNESENCYEFLFSLLDSNSTPISGATNVSMRIVNDGETVYSDYRSVSKSDFSNWGNDYKGYKLTCCIRIPYSEIGEGKNTSGTFYYQVDSFDEYSLSINKLPVKTVRKITLDKYNLELSLGEEYTLTATPDANDSYLKWKSSDEKIATVYSGKVTAKSVGETIITVTASNGVESTCRVTVKSPITLTMPSFPLTRSNYRYNGNIEQTYTLTKVTLEDLYKQSSGSYSGKLYFSGTKDYDYRGSGQGDSVKISWKIYDGNTVIDSGTNYSSSVTIGEGFARSYSYVTFPEPGTYRLEITSTN